MHQIKGFFNKIIMNHIGFVIATVRNPDISKRYIWKNQIKAIVIKGNSLKALYFNMAIGMKVFGNSSCNRV